MPGPSSHSFEIFLRMEVRKRLLLLLLLLLFLRIKVCPNFLPLLSAISKRRKERHGGFADCRERRFSALSTDFFSDGSVGGAPLALIGRFLNNGREEDTVVRGTICCHSEVAIELHRLLLLCQSAML